MTAELLTAVGIVKSFGQTKALQGVDLHLLPGEVRGLIGENGSGKSTLCTIISGVFGCDSGEMFLNGEPYLPEGMIDGQSKGVAMIVQEMGTIPGIGIADNIFIGKENRFMKGGLVNRRKMTLAAKEVLHGIGVTDIDPGNNIDELNFEDRKLIEIARAIYDEPKVLIVDETTTALSQRGRDIVHALCRKLSVEGKGVLFISHDLDEVMDICTALTVLRDGVLIGTLNKAEMEPGLIKSMMVGRELVGDYYRSDSDGSYGEKVVLHFDGISDGRSLHGVSLDLHEGEILGLGGLTNCGMHEVGRIAFGIEKPILGKVTAADGFEISQPSAATKRNIGYISKNRDQESLMITATVAENIALPSLQALTKGGLLTKKNERRLAQEQRETLSIKCEDVDQIVRFLSGGNKQKVVFGRWIGKKSRILILDCPTRGVDIGVKQAMYQLIYKLKTEGCSILLISEELPELIGMSDRILIMKDGRISAEFMRGTNVTEHNIIEYMI